MRVGTRHEFRGLKRVIALTVVFNLLDGVCTLVWVQARLAREANPLMGWLLAFDPVVFMGVKTALVYAGLWVLWRQRGRPTAVVALFLVFLVYYTLVAYHATAVGVLLAVK